LAVDKICRYTLSVHCLHKKTGANRYVVQVSDTTMLMYELLLVK